MTSPAAAPTPTELQDLRDGVADGAWRDVDDADDLTAAEIVRGIEHSYGGGVAQFLDDAGRQPETTAGGAS